MNKYIDAEKLIAEIERVKAEKTRIYEMLPKDDLDAVLSYAQRECLKQLGYFITSLQQDKDVLDLCSQVWWEDRGWIMIPPNVTLKGIESLLERVRHKIKWDEENGIAEQEQPEVSLKVSGFCQPIPKNIADCIAEHYWEMLGEEEKDDTKAIEAHSQREQPEVDLENYFKGWHVEEEIGLTKPDGWSCIVADLKDIARHFYSLGLNARKEE